MGRAPAGHQHARRGLRGIRGRALRPAPRECRHARVRAGPARGWRGTDVRASARLPGGAHGSAGRARGRRLRGHAGHPPGARRRGRETPGSGPPHRPRRDPRSSSVASARPSASAGQASPVGSPGASSSASTAAIRSSSGPATSPRCDSDADTDTAALLAKQPGIVFTAGDNVYPQRDGRPVHRLLRPHVGQGAGAHTTHGGQPRSRHGRTGRLSRILRGCGGTAGHQLVRLRPRDVARDRAGCDVRRGGRLRP